MLTELFTKYHSDWILMHTPDETFVLYKEPSELISEESPISVPYTLKKLAEVRVKHSASNFKFLAVGGMDDFFYIVHNGTVSDVKEIEELMLIDEVDIKATTRLIEVTYGVTL